MTKEITFIAGDDLAIIIGEESIVLRKGFLHVNEVSIDKEKSSKGFLDLFYLLAKERILSVSTDNEYYDDFMKLVYFRLLDIKVEGSDFIIIDDPIYESLAPHFTAPCDKISKYITEDDSNVSNIERDAFVKYFSGYSHIYYLGLFVNLFRLRIINKLLFELNKEYTIGFIDEGNVYLAAIRPHYSGCYSCLEKKIMSHFPGKIEDYMYDSSIGDISNPNRMFDAQLLLLASLVQADQHNISTYGSSSLTGSVAHFYLPNFEYSFEYNRKDAACKVCSGINNARFEEQNALSINLLTGAE